MLVKSLTCEFLPGPIAVDATQPRLGWMLVADEEERAKVQSAYQVLVASSPDLLNANEGDVWDSGKESSAASCHVPYQGVGLHSRQIYYWKVKVWDEDGIESVWSDPASWIMGILTDADWDETTRWIGVHEQVSFEDRFPITKELEDVPEAFKAVSRKYHPKGEGLENEYAAGVYLRKEFTLERPTAEVARAIVRVSGLGYYELSLNGGKVGDHMLDPGATDYTKRVFYVTYDVKEQLQDGDNCVGVILGCGWYFVGTPDLFGFEKAPWAAPQKCRLELEVLYNDGEQFLLGTDESWTSCTSGPIRFNCIRSGEVYDATMELGAWDTVGGVASAPDLWKQAILVPRPQGGLRSQMCPPITIERVIKPEKHLEPVEGILVYYFPENLAGWVQISVQGQPGQKVTLKLNEKLLDDGQVDTATHSGHTYGRFQTCEYICNGLSVETWHPHFSYQGFQFVQVEGAGEDQIVDIEAHFVHTAAPRAGEFSCSNSLVNWIDEISRRTFLNGLHSYPEDCPQREKAGWTEDGVISAQGSIYNFDCLRMYEKWARDLADAQVEGGQVPDIVPTPGWGKPGLTEKTPEYGNMADPWWGGALVLLPWTLYRHYGDLGILRECYPAMKKYVVFLASTAGDEKVIRWTTLLGDWLEVGAGGPATRTPKELTCTQAFYHYARILAQSAQVLGEQDDETYFTALAGDIFAAFNCAFLNEETGSYGEDSQSAPAMSLFTGLVPEDLQGKVVEELIKNIQETREGHLSTGIVGSYFLYQSLARSGSPEVAYDVITAKGFPGFEYMQSFQSNKQAATTTLWEDWEARSSLCHPVQGCAVSFFYEFLAGIRPVPEHPGFKRFIVAPQIVRDLTQVTAHLDTLYGTIRVKWQVAGKMLGVSIEVPPNTSA